VRRFQTGSGAVIQNPRLYPAGALQKHFLQLGQTGVRSPPVQRQN
jgi:hypothetical protein